MVRCFNLLENFNQLLINHLINLICLLYCDLILIQQYKAVLINFRNQQYQNNQIQLISVIQIQIKSTFNWFYKIWMRPIRVKLFSVTYTLQLSKRRAQII
ncbi:unnamed protein product [Paramecium primaurelia]|uniref:Uncharacterized protein n=1 Tax=Paramecium primaurelia TaxID=5886 RepID=A0A8S1PPM0_PARPR|nr:unnamed protein product [Paramecium primaurelia]